MQIIRLALTSMAFAALPSAAFAQSSEQTGAYFGLQVGTASIGDADVVIYDAGGTFGGSGATDSAAGRYDLKSALTFGGTLGYDFGPVRADIEIDYAKHKIDSFTINSVNGSAVTLTAADRADVCDYLEANSCGGSGNTFVIDGSRARTLSAMGNLWVDLPIGGTVVPYAGGGLGITGFEVDGEGKAKFAWQLGAGVGFNVSPSVVLSADYRHREVSATEVAYDASSGYRIGKLKTDAITARVRFMF